MELEGGQNDLVRAVLAANPHTVVVLQNGAPLALPWVQQAPAILEAGLAGETAPQAIAQLLFGDANPSGKLAYTFPRRLADNPAYLYYSAGHNASYGEGVFVGYRYYDKRDVEPLFEFGRGLSYTSFEYGSLSVPASVPTGTDIPVTLEVRNTGSRAGSEAVQLYLGDGATTEVVRPVRELKAFDKITLAPGERRQVRFTLTPRDLAYYDAARRAWTSTPGTHTVYLGSSSRDIRLQQSFEWQAARDPRAPGSEPRPSAF
jgi:beta-glucosidase